MKKKIKFVALLTLMSFLLNSCEKFSEVNKNPNSPEEVSSNYILSYVLTNTAQVYYRLGAEDSKLAGTMQYIQRGTNENAIEVNYYGWKPDSWGQYYNILRNAQIIYDNSEKDNSNFFKAISLTMRSFLFGLLTDLYGDVPYSEALNASEGVFFPKYDQQQDIYVGIMKELKEADRLLSNLNENDQVNAVSDVLYKGDPLKWKKFVNSLRLRYAMRLAAKRADIKEKGVDLIQEFTDAVPKAFTSIADDAKIDFLGVNGESSAVGGPLNNKNPLYYMKPGQPLLNQLVATNDPRLDRWILPVLQKWDKSATVATATTYKNRFAESYSVTLMPLGNTNVDQSYYVGLPIGLPNLEALNYNKGNDTEAYHSERSPYISFLHDRYRLNSEKYLNMTLISYSEVAFILAEAALDGGFGVSGSSEQHYKNGILASLNRWGALEAENFNFDSFYAQPTVSYTVPTNKLERIMEQKWVASWLEIQSWFDWRRTGYPALKPGPIAQSGPALPIRFMYPTPNLDPNYLVNYEDALNRLERTIYVPSDQSADHPYSKMWLLQKTSKPW